MIEDTTPSPLPQWQKWVERVEGRISAFDSGWWRMARKANDMYEAKEGDNSNPFNILYANTEVLLPSLYSATPKPDVAARWDSPPEAATACERLLTTLIDPSCSAYESLDSAMQGTVLSALVPGLGGVRVRAYPGTVEPLRWEEYKFDQFVWGYARKWTKVPWVAFLHPMTKEDIVSEFELSPEAAAEIQVPTQEEQDTKKGQEKGEKTHYVYEVWIKSQRTTVFLCPNYKPLLLRQVEDVLRLDSFFPTPRPLALVRKPGSLEPTPIYEYYRSQAEELNRVTVRLNKVLSALKVRGVYNPLIGTDIEQILSDDNMENGLKPSNVPQDLSGKGFEGQIWLMPLDKLTSVAQQLYQARLNILNVIQQISGLADILRGATVASETATAQSLKSKWGTVRLRRMQREVSLYVRELLRMALDAATSVLPPEEWRRMTGLPFLFAQEKAQLGVQVQQLMQVDPQTGQPAAPPPPQLLQKLQQPSWEELLAALADDGGRGYIIDIETDSTVDTEAGQDKQEVVEFMQGFAQLMQAMGPLAQLGPSGLEAGKSIVIAVAKRFKFGREVIASFKNLDMTQPPQNQKQDSAGAAKAQAAQAEMAIKQLELQLKQKEAAFREQELVRKTELADKEYQLKLLQLQQSMVAPVLPKLRK